MRQALFSAKACVRGWARAVGNNQWLGSGWHKWIVRQTGSDPLAQLLLVTAASLSDLMRSHYTEAAYSNQVGDKCAYVFVKIKFNEEVIH